MYISQYIFIYIYIYIYILHVYIAAFLTVASLAFFYRLYLLFWGSSFDKKSSVDISKKEIGAVSFPVFFSNAFFTDFRHVIIF